MEEVPDGQYYHSQFTGPVERKLTCAGRQERGSPLKPMSGKFLKRLQGLESDKKINILELAQDYASVRKVG